MLHLLAPVAQSGEFQTRNPMASGSIRVGIVRVQIGLPGVFEDLRSFLKNFKLRSCVKEPDGSK